MKVALEFSVLRFWLFLRSVFVPKKPSVFAVLMFIAICGFSAIYHLVFGFREKYQRDFGFDIRCGFLFFLFDLFGFRFLFDLSGNLRASTDLE